MRVSTSDSSRKAVSQYLIAIVLSLLLVLFIGSFTNVMTPKWDGLNYVDMAKNGITKNAALVAPFAYRPGAPFAARLLANIFSLTIERGFQILGWLASILMLFIVFILARYYSRDFATAIYVVIIVSMMGIHIKSALFYYSLVDISAYGFMVIAFWALLKRYYVLCLLASGIGIFFKEFLAIPLFILLYCLLKEYFKLRSKKYLAFFLVATLVTLMVIIVPRLTIPVQQTEQEIDPLNAPGSLMKIATIPFKKARDINIVFALLSYWLPTLLLITKKRAQYLWQQLGEIRTILLIYIFLNLVLVMYGGTNVMIFVSYMLPLQVVVLASLIKRDVQGWEIAYVILVLIVFFRIFQAIPLPEFDFGKYIDFYGGWGSRLNLATVFRFLQIALFILLANGLRLGIQRFGKHPDEKLA